MRDARPKTSLDAEKRWVMEHFSGKPILKINGF